MGDEDDENKQPISQVFAKPCIYCYDSGKPHSNCPWFRIGKCNGMFNQLYIKPKQK